MPYVSFVLPFSVESVSALLYSTSLYLHEDLLKVAFLVSRAGRKSLVFRVQNIDHRIEPIPSHLMASENEFSELNRNLYPQIEPYSTGFLKVSDLHTIYWEQSGNPSGHVSSNCLQQSLEFLCLFLKNLTFLSLNAMWVVYWLNWMNGIVKLFHWTSSSQFLDHVF